MSLSSPASGMTTMSLEEKLKAGKYFVSILERSAQMMFYLFMFSVGVWCLLFAGGAYRSSKLSLALDVQRLPLRDSAETLQARLHHLHEGWYSPNASRTPAQDFLVRAEIGHGLGEFLCRRELYRSFAFQLGIVKMLTVHTSPSPWIEWVESKISPFSSHDIEGYRDAKKHRLHMENIRKSFYRQPCDSNVWALSSGGRRLLAELLLVNTVDPSCKPFSWFHEQLEDGKSKLSSVYTPIIDEILRRQHEDSVRCKIRQIHRALVDFVRAFDEGETVPRERLRYISSSSEASTEPAPYRYSLEL